MKRIPLTQDRFAVVDDGDYDWLMRWKWSFSGKYAWRLRPSGEPGPRHILMHRLILGVDGVPLAESGEVDHIDRDRLNNQRSNLRMSDHRANQANTAPRSASGVKGVRRRRNSWQAYAVLPRVDGAQKFVSLGHFETFEEAVAARKEYEKGVTDATREEAKAG